MGSFRVLIALSGLAGRAAPRDELPASANEPEQAWHGSSTGANVPENGMIARACRIQVTDNQRSDWASGISLKHAWPVQSARCLVVCGIWSFAC